MNKIAICLICKNPNDVWLYFFNEFINHDIYLIIDNNFIDITHYKHNYKNINFIQINENYCFENGYMNSNLFMYKIINGWDKAIYYFSFINNNYDFVWYLEDDVFVYNEKTFDNLNNTYNNIDINIT